MVISRCHIPVNGTKSNIYSNEDVAFVFKKDKIKIAEVWEAEIRRF